MRQATTAEYADLPSEELRYRLLSVVGSLEVPNVSDPTSESGAGRPLAGTSGLQARELFGFSFTHKRLRSLTGRAVSLTLGPCCVGMALDERNARRLGHATSNGLPPLLRCDGFPQFSQEGWGRLNRCFNLVPRSTSLRLQQGVPYSS